MGVSTLKPEAGSTLGFADYCGRPGGGCCQTVAADPLHPAWVEAAQRVNRRYANRSSLVRSLATLSDAKAKL